jgi:nucleoside-diphosphate-sugar epimerase
MVQVLIVGGNSLVSKEIASLELSNGYKVFCTVNQNSTRILESCDIISLESAFKMSFERVYLIAANIPYGNFSEVTDDLVKSNIDLPRVISERFPSSKLIYSSSVSVFGNQINITDESPLTPTDAYGVSKAVAEIIVKRHAKYAILRLSSIYGDGINDKGFVTRVLSQAREGEIMIFGNGERTQNYVHYKTAGELLVAMGNDEKSQIFNCILEKSISNISIAKALKKINPLIEIKLEGEDLSSSSNFEVVNPSNYYKLFTFEPLISYIQNNL